VTPKERLDQRYPENAGCTEEGGGLSISGSTIKVERQRLPAQPPEWGAVPTVLMPETATSSAHQSGGGGDDDLYGGG